MSSLLPFVRALALRCPQCGGGGILRHWFALHPACPTCGLDFDRGESGYQVGSYLVAMIVIELLFVGLFVAVLMATWPTPPWRLLQWGGPLLMLLGPLVLFPFTKTGYLAFDLTFRKEL
jgi:uncharacterized protein (DUF983 family)